MFLFAAHLKISSYERSCKVKFSLLDMIILWSNVKRVKSNFFTEVIEMRKWSWQPLSERLRRENALRVFTKLSAITSSSRILDEIWSINDKFDQSMINPNWRILDEIWSMFDLINLTNHQQENIGWNLIKPSWKFDQFEQAGGEFDQSEVERILILKEFSVTWVFELLPL